MCVCVCVCVCVCESATLTRNSAAQLENVLYHPQQQVFKLCDFGSATTQSLCVGGDVTVQAVEDEISKFTTLPV